MFHTFHGLTNGRQYYAKIFTVNAQGRVNNRIDLPVLTAIPYPFPEQPASEAEYSLITEITSTQTFAAPEDGWFLIEVHGASGGGGKSGLADNSWYAKKDANGVSMVGYKTGGSGAGSSYGASVVKLCKGDVLTITIGEIGQATSAAIASTAGESYETISVTPSGSGTDASVTSDGIAGIPGESTGGNLFNLSGTPGKDGEVAFFYDRSEVTLAPKSGGEPANLYGNSGGGSAYITAGKRYAPTPGKPGKVRISRGWKNRG